MNRLRILLEKHRISLTLLSAESGIHRPTLVNIRDYDSPKTVQVVKIIKAINSIAGTKYTYGDFFCEDHCIHEVLHG